MDKRVVGQFRRWLDTASDRELTERRALLAALADRADDRDDRRDITFLLRLLAEEQQARREVARLRARR